MKWNNLDESVFSLKSSDSLKLLNQKLYVQKEDSNLKLMIVNNLGQPPVDLPERKSEMDETHLFLSTLNGCVMPLRCY